MERILVCSDIHRFKENFWEALVRSQPIDRIFICGDLEGYPEDYRAMAQTTPIVMVQGNCDYYLGSDLPPVVEFELEGKRILITHGHLFHVGGKRPRFLIDSAKNANADLVFFGHTHKPLDEVWDDIHFVNPGALRGDPSGGTCSYVIFTLDGATGQNTAEFFTLS